MSVQYFYRTYSLELVAPRPSKQPAWVFSVMQKGPGVAPAGTNVYDSGQVFSTEDEAKNGALEEIRDLRRKERNETARSQAKWVPA